MKKLQVAHCRAITTIVISLAATLSAIDLAAAQARRPHCHRPGDSARFEDVPCPAAVQASTDAFALPAVRCGYVEVPESYGRACGDTLRLFVVIAETEAARPRAPVLFLAGGPGQSLTSIAGQVFATGAMGRVRAQRDIVLIDPRGAGYSEPRLRCPPPAPGAAPAATLTPRQAESLRCARELQAQGVDLSAYDTSNLARDVKRVRDALNAPKVGLFAVSYGALLGLHTLRGARAWVESAVLVSLPDPRGGTVVRSGVSAQEALDTLARDCEQQPGCAAFGDLRANLDALLAQLTLQPLEVRATAGSPPLLLTADLLAIVVQSALGTPAITRALPRAVAEALQGRGALWVPWVEAFSMPPPIDIEEVVSRPLHNSIWCAEELSIGSAEQMRRRASRTDPIVQRYFVPPLVAEYETCAVWPVPDAPRSFYAPVVSDIPTYLVAGALDPITRPSFSEYAVRYLRHGQLTVFADAGHLPAEFAACGPELVARFFDAPYAPVEDSCAALPVSFLP